MRRLPNDLTMVMTMVIMVPQRVAKGRGMTTLTAGSGDRTIKASEFKAKCLALMDEVADTGEEIVITKRGAPVARLSAYRGKPEPFFGADRDIIKIHGDVVGPVMDDDWEEEWIKQWDEWL